MRCLGRLWVEVAGCWWAERMVLARRLVGEEAERHLAATELCVLVLVVQMVLRQGLVVLRVALLGRLVVGHQLRRWSRLHRRSWSWWDQDWRSSE